MSAPFIVRFYNSKDNHSLCLIKIFVRLVHNVTVLLAMADCQAKTDESAEIIILGCTAETLQPRAIGAIQSYRLGLS